MKHKAPNLRTVILHGKKTFLVSWPNPSAQRPNRKFFAASRKSEAEAFLLAKQAEFENFGLHSGTMPEALRSDALRAAALLEPTGKSVLDAARFFLDHWQKQTQGKPIAEAVEAFLATLEKSSHHKSVAPRLRSFVSVAGERTTASVTQSDVEDFLAGLEGFAPRTIAHHRAHLHALFNFCRGRGWCVENPVAAIRPPKVSAPEPEILTPAQARALLEACDDELLPGVAIAMFCGLRQAEIEKLEWSAVNLVDGHITIGAKIAKTNSRRVVTMPSNLKAFLRLVKDRKGHVWPESSRDKWNMTRIAAGFGPFHSGHHAVQEAIAKAKKAKRKLIPWPGNALRHSAISYRVAQERDLARIAYESGNSPAIIQRHYNGLASPKDAAAFFGITPKKSKKVLEPKFAA
jgi:integrase